MRLPSWPLTLLLVFCLLFLLQHDIRRWEENRLVKRLTGLPVAAPDPSIVIVGVDDEVHSLHRFNRQEHARVIDNLTRAGVRQIFLDIIFDEPRGSQFDLPLRESIRRSGRVTVAGAYQGDRNADWFVQRPKFYPELQELVRNGLCQMGIVNTSRVHDKSFVPVAYLDHGLEDPKYNPWGPGMRPSAAVAMVAANNHLTSRDLEVVPANEWRGALLNISPLKLEVERRSEGEIEVLLIPIRYHPAATGPRGEPGGPGRIKVIPYLKVADGDPATLAALKNCFVLIGDNTKGPADVYETPVGPIKGVEIHSQLLDALLHNRIPHLAMPGSAFLLQSQILIGFLCLGLTALMKRQPSLWRCGLVMAASFGLWKAGLQLGDQYNYFLPQTLGEVALFCTGMFSLLFRFLATQRVLRTFIPAAIVDQLMRDEQIHQGAVEATVMVTDIRGYTTLSESRTPTQVLELLNDYHTETVAHYEKFGGHVLNYQGDAQIILFGHPKKLKDPALQAIRAAQAASSAVEVLRKRWKLPADQAFNVGAGICTGKVIIAELGGEYREYTVIGEIVRKCHKLQSQSQILGANIILDEETYARCMEKPQVEKRENVSIDGLPEPVTVYITDILIK